MDIHKVHFLIFLVGMVIQNTTVLTTCIQKHMKQDIKLYLIKHIIRKVMILIVNTVTEEYEPLC